MDHLISRTVEYRDGTGRMLGHFCAAASDRARPSLLLVHDAFGLGPELIATAEEYAALGFAVLAADVWGDRLTPATDAEIGPLIGAMLGDRARWIGRVAAARDALAAQPEADPSTISAVGYCFGGSSLLEYLRTGGELHSVVGVHAGLDLLAPDWSAAAGSARVLLCSGADDPMATPAQREELQTALSGAGIDWELDLYSDTKHAFTNPRSDLVPMDAVAYNARSTRRAGDRTTGFLADVLAASTES